MWTTATENRLAESANLYNPSLPCYSCRHSRRSSLTLCSPWIPGRVRLCKAHHSLMEGNYPRKSRDDHLVRTVAPSSADRGKAFRRPRSQSQNRASDKQAAPGQGTLAMQTLPQFFLYSSGQHPKGGCGISGALRLFFLACCTDPTASLCSLQRLSS